MSIEAVRVCLALLGILFLTMFFMSNPPHHVAVVFAFLTGMAVGAVIGSNLGRSDNG